MKIRLQTPKTTTEANQFMRVGIIGIFSVALVDYFLSTQAEIIIWPPLVGLLLLLGVASTMYGGVQYIIISRRPVAHTVVETIAPSGLDFSMLNSTQRARVTEVRFVLGFSILAVFGLIAGILLSGNTKPILPELILPLSVFSILFLAIGVYLVLTYLLWRKVPKGFMQSLREFSNTNSFTFNNESIQDRLSELLQDTPYYRSKTFVMGSRLAVYASISGVYRNSQFILAACRGDDYFGMITLQIAKRFTEIENSKWRDVLLNTHADIADVIFDGETVIIVLHQGLFEDQASMRHYFNIIDSSLDVQTSAIY